MLSSYPSASCHGSHWHSSKNLQAVSEDFLFLTKKCVLKAFKSACWATCQRSEYLTAYFASPPGGPKGSYNTSVQKSHSMVVYAKPTDFSVFQVLMNGIGPVSHTTSAACTASVTKPRFCRSAPLSPLRPSPQPSSVSPTNTPFLLLVTAGDASSVQKASAAPPTTRRDLGYFLKSGRLRQRGGYTAAAHSPRKMMGQSKVPATALWGHFASVGILDCCLIRSVVCRADMCQIPSSRAPRITHYTSPHRCLPREVTTHQRW